MRSILPLLLVIGIGFLILQLVKLQTYRGYKSGNEACQSFYGTEYKYIKGHQSPSICTTTDGRIRYYELIEYKD